MLPAPHQPALGQTDHNSAQVSQLITLFMGGDVMTGRGLDQVLPHPGDPRLHEPSVQDARLYVALAVAANGAIPQPVDYAYIWGAALEELASRSTDIRMINLETSITTSNDYQLSKGIHYRMHPLNIPCLAAAGIDFCSLGNNHILDWGRAGLLETVESLENAGIKYAGAGSNLSAAEAPALFNVAGKGRVLVFSYGTMTSGIPQDWHAAENKPGVNLLAVLSPATIRRIKAEVDKAKGERDIVVASIHWGGNWGYEIPANQRQFAHDLIDSAGVDVIHGHSSHHVKGLEVYKDKLIIYGCGDLINDYEGISGYESYRDDLGLMYFASVHPSTGRLVQLQMTPTRIKNYRLNRVSEAEALWLRDTLNREGRLLGTRVQIS
ncbi:MAG: CapA family protein [Fidelibacterota bacterium]|nr:MAG: CapA family protein [Candidatus Neomarinimicrobiota bacterium]